MTKPRISTPEQLAEVDRLLAATADARAEAARERAEREHAEAGDPVADHARRTGVIPPEQS